MKLQLRFLFVLAVIFVAVLSFLFIQQKFEIDRSKSLLRSELKQNEAYFTNIVNLDGHAEQAFAEDYSFWDAMVQFVKTGGLPFAHENLDTGLGTFAADADWVFRPNGSPLYFSSADGSNALQPLDLSPAFFKQLSASKLAHFYIRADNQTVEIRAATIVPSNDPDHRTPEQGFLLIGRVLDQAYISNLAKLSSSTVKLAGATDTANATTNNTVSFGEVLPGWDTRPVAVLRSTSTVGVISDLKLQYNHELELIIAFTVLAVGIVTTMLWLLVLRPVDTVSRAIKQQRPELLARLQRQRTEFGQLATTVTEFFQQKVSLSEAEFKRTELEKLNKEKSSFLAVAAHELNSPVANVKLFAEYLSFLLQKNHDRAKIDQQVHRIEHQTAKINMLLNDLRAASEGKQQLEFNQHDFDFDAFLREEIAEAGFSVHHKLNLYCDTHALVHSDPDRLGQVVTNLIRNAAKYSPDGGDIIIRGIVQDDHVLVSFQDFGVGILPEGSATYI